MQQWVPLSSYTGMELGFQFQFLSRDTGYAVIPYAGNLLLRTTNGGQQWDATTTLLSSSEALYFTDFYTGYMWGYDGIIRTKDGGITWKKISLRPTYSGKAFSDGSGVFYQQVRSCGGDQFFAFVGTSDYGDSWEVGSLTRSYFTQEHIFHLNERCIFAGYRYIQFTKWLR